MSVAAITLIIIVMQALAVVVVIIENCLSINGISTIALKIVMFVYLVVYLFKARKLADKLNIEFYKFNILSFVLWHIFGFTLLFLWIMAISAGIIPDFGDYDIWPILFMGFDFIMYSLRVEVLNFIIFIINKIKYNY